MLVHNPESLIKLLHISGANFPIGGFSHSFGLETYVTEKTITDGAGFCEFVKSMLYTTVSDCDGPAMCLAYNSTLDGDVDSLMHLDDFFTSLKLSRESRDAQTKMGRAFIRLALSMYPEDEFLSTFQRMSKKSNVNYPVVFGAVCARIGIDLYTATTAFVNNAVNSAVQAGIKLVPLGSTESQQIIVDLYPHILDAINASMDRTIDELGSFSPGLDLASMRHERLYTRLYMS